VLAGVPVPAAGAGVAGAIWKATRAMLARSSSAEADASGAAAAESPVASAPEPLVTSSDWISIDRGGDRQANKTLHMIAVCRLRHCPRTRAYAARRTTQGKTRRDVKRCLKRSIARQLFKLLERYDQPGVEILRAA